MLPSDWLLLVMASIFKMLYFVVSKKLLINDNDLHFSGIFLLQDNYISVEIEDGVLVLKYKLNSNPVKQIKSTFGRVNDGKEHLVCTE